MFRLKFLLSLVISLFMGLTAFSQEVEMANELRASGKIYIVVAVLAIIFIGIVIYLFRIDKKVTRLEKEIEEK